MKKCEWCGQEKETVKYDIFEEMNLCKECSDSLLYGEACHNGEA